jgi:hypothetical protein
MRTALLVKICPHIGEFSAEMRYYEFEITRRELGENAVIIYR